MLTLEPAVTVRVFSQFIQLFWPITAETTYRYVIHVDKVLILFTITFMIGVGGFDVLIEFISNQFLISIETVVFNRINLLVLSTFLKLLIQLRL